METNSRDDLVFDWDANKVRCRGVEVELTRDWLKNLRIALGDPWCPQKVPINNCACWDLVLRDGDATGYPLENLDHVSSYTMEATCESWLQWSLAVAPWGYRDCVPVQLWAGLWTEPTCLFDIYEGFYHDKPAWPVPLQDSVYGLGLALREWVEEPPDRRLRRVLLSRPETAVACTALRDAEVWKHLDHHAKEPFWFGLPPAQAILERHGLPSTPTTTLFLLAHAGAPTFESLDLPPPEAPSRGLCVHSFGLLPLDKEVTSGGIMVHRVEGNAAWRTDELDREAGKTAKKHARWWASLPPTRTAYVDLRRFNRPKEDPLAKLVRECAHGTLKREDLIQHAYDYYQPETPVDKANVRKLVSSRLSRSRTRLDPRLNQE